MKLNDDYIDELDGKKQDNLDETSKTKRRGRPKKSESGKTTIPKSPNNSSDSKYLRTPSRGKKNGSSKEGSVRSDNYESDSTYSGDGSSRTTPRSRTTENDFKDTIDQPIDCTFSPSHIPDIQSPTEEYYDEEFERLEEGPYELSQETITDYQGNKYTHKDMVKNILQFKAENGIFFLGASENCCHKDKRNKLDCWYRWNNELADSVESGLSFQARILENHSKEKINQLCESIKSESWNDSIKLKCEKLAHYLDEFGRILSAPGGISTMWGELEYEGPFTRMANDALDKIIKQHEDKNVFDLVDFVEYFTEKWTKRFEDEELKEQIKKAYD